MDKIDVVLFRYRRERKKCPEITKMAVIMYIPLFITLIMDVVSLFFLHMIQGRILLGIGLLSMFIWIKFMEAKWGTAKWKKRILTARRARFKTNQESLIEIINEEKMNCQQVYNGLVKKHSRLPQSTDRRGYIITILSLIIALTGILVSPIKDVGLEYYESYIISVFELIVLLGVFGYIMYRIMNVQNMLYDAKKEIYEDVLELLEDRLY